MARYILAAILVGALGACANEDADVAAIDAGVLMSTGGPAAGQGADQVHQVPLAPPDAYDPPDAVASRSLEARIFDLSAGPAKGDYPPRAWTVYDVIPRSRTNADLVEPSWPSTAPAEPRESPAAAAAAAPPEPRRGPGVAETSYQIQLGALPSKNSAEREWTRIERHHPDLVRNQVPWIVPVEPNAEIGEVFRLRTGPIGKLEAARSLCQEFKSRGQDCFVVEFSSSG